MTIVQRARAAIALSFMLLAGIVPPANASYLQPYGYAHKWGTRDGFNHWGPIGYISLGNRVALGWRFRHKTYNAVPVSRPIKIDGKLDDAAWKNAVLINGFQFSDSADVPAARAVEARVLYDEENLYIGIRCHADLAGSRPLKKPAPRDSMAVWREDHVEIYLDPKHLHRAPYLLVVGKSGSIYDGVFHFDPGLAISWQFGGKNNTFDRSWTPHWDRAVSVGKNEWSVEIAVPFAELGVKPGPAAIVGLGLGRGNVYHDDQWGRVDGQRMMWHPTAFFAPYMDLEGGRTPIAFPDALDMLDMVFDSPVSISNLRMTGMDVYNVSAATVTVKNTGKRALKVEVTLEKGPVPKKALRMPRFYAGYGDLAVESGAKASVHKEVATISLAPGASTDVTLKTGMPPGSIGHARLRLVVADDGRTYYDAWFHLVPWRPGKHEPIWKDKTYFEPLSAHLAEPAWAKQWKDIVDVLLSIDETRCIPLLIGMCDLKDHKARIYAVQKLTKLAGNAKGGPKDAAIEAIRKLLDDKKAEVVAVAAGTLMAWGDAQSLKVVKEKIRIMVTGEDWQRRRDGITILTKIFQGGNVRDKEFVVEMLEAGSKNMRSQQVPMALSEAVGVLNDPMLLPFARRMYEEGKKTPVYVIGYVRLLLDQGELESKTALKELERVKNFRLMTLKPWYPVSQRLVAAIKIVANGGTVAADFMDAEPAAAKVRDGMVNPNRYHVEMTAEEACETISRLPTGWHGNIPKMLPACWALERLKDPSWFKLTEPLMYKTLDRWATYFCGRMYMRAGEREGYRTFIRYMITPQPRANGFVHNDMLNIGNPGLQDLVGLTWYFDGPGPRFLFTTTAGDSIALTPNVLSRFTPEGVLAAEMPLPKNAPIDATVALVGGLAAKIWDLELCSFNPTPMVEHIPVWRQLGRLGAVAKSASSDANLENPIAELDLDKPVKAGVWTGKGGRKLLYRGPDKIGKSSGHVSVELSQLVADVKPDTLYFLGVTTRGLGDDMKYERYRNDHIMKIEVYDLSDWEAPYKEHLEDTRLLNTEVLHKGDAWGHRIYAFRTLDDTTDLLIRFRNIGGKGHDSGHLIDLVVLTPLLDAERLGVGAEVKILAGTGGEGQKAAAYRSKTDPVRPNLRTVIRPGHTRFQSGKGWRVDVPITGEEAPSFAIAYGSVREYVLELHDPETDQWRPVAAGVNRVDPVHVMVLPDDVMPDMLRFYFRTADKGGGCSGVEVY